ncbi:MAG: Minf_1886 family protein [Fuerstiella sp.]
MAATRQTPTKRAYHRDGYTFIFSGLKYAQDHLGRDRSSSNTGHVSGPELLIGIKGLAQEKFGLMARSVLGTWGIQSTADIGKMVFELIEDGDMSKTTDDRLEDFVDVYDFAEVFDRSYEIDTSQAFSKA